jgi:hypothetical protein
LEGGGCSLIWDDILVFRWTEEIYENLSFNSQCPRRNSNRVLPSKSIDRYSYRNPLATCTFNLSRRYECSDSCLGRFTPWRNPLRLCPLDSRLCRPLTRFGPAGNRTPTPPRSPIKYKYETIFCECCFSPVFKSSLDWYMQRRVSGPVLNDFLLCCR